MLQLTGIGESALSNSDEAKLWGVRRKCSFKLSHIRKKQFF